MKLHLGDFGITHPVFAQFFEQTTDGRAVAVTIKIPVKSEAFFFQPDKYGASILILIKMFADCAGVFVVIECLNLVATQQRASQFSQSDMSFDLSKILTIFDFSKVSLAAPSRLCSLPICRFDQEPPVSVSSLSYVPPCV